MLYACGRPLCLGSHEERRRLRSDRPSYWCITESQRLGASSEGMVTADNLGYPRTVAKASERDQSLTCKLFSCILSTTCFCPSASTNGLRTDESSVVGWCFEALAATASSTLVRDTAGGLMATRSGATPIAKGFAFLRCVCHPAAKE